MHQPPAENHHTLDADGGIRSNGRGAIVGQ